MIRIADLSERRRSTLNTTDGASPARSYAQVEENWFYEPNAA